MRWLSEASGRHYRLMSEAEWEYLARTGAPDAPAERASGPASPDSLTADGLGLRGLLGNVWEWVADCAHPDYRKAPTGGEAWLAENGGDCTYGVARGGSWYDRPTALNASNRLILKADSKLWTLGLRIARDLSQEECANFANRSVADPGFPTHQGL